MGLFFFSFVKKKMAAEQHSATFNYAMTCEGCATVAKNILKKNPKVTSVETNVAAGTVVVVSSLPKEEILSLLKKTGKTCSIQE